MTADTYTADLITIWQRRRERDGLTATDHTCYPADPGNLMSGCVHPHRSRRTRSHDEIADRAAVDDENRYEEWLWGREL